MSQSKLPVYLRIKPKTAEGTFPEQFLSILPGSTQVLVDPPKGSRILAQETFSFSGVYDESTTQLKLYTETVFPLVENVIRGNDSLFFAMGASGSGKTHTTLGYKRTPGMIHLALDTVFKSIKDHTAEFESVELLSDERNPTRTSAALEAGLILDWAKAKSPAFLKASMCKDTVECNNKYTYAMYISMVEIYNDRIFDLFDDPNTVNKDKAPRRKALLAKAEPDTGRTYLANVKKIFVAEANEAYKIIDKGLSVRSAHFTESNSTSSRSHAFIVLEVKRIPQKKDQPIKSSTLTFVDLAGSERVKVSKTLGNRLVESCAINKSLMLLGQCLQKQRDREHANSKELKTDFSIFRNSKLTQLLLANAFNKDLNQKSVLLVTIDPYGDCNAASQMLRYAALARDVSVPKARVVSGSSVDSFSSRSVTGASIRSDRSDRSDTSATSAMSSSSTFNEDERLLGGASDPDTKQMFSRIAELELELEQANERCATIEQEVREEMAVEMDACLEELQNRFRDALEEDHMREQELADRKLELLSGSIGESRFQDLRVEIQRLNIENFKLAQELALYRQERVKRRRVED